MRIALEFEKGLNTSSPEFRSAMRRIAQFLVANGGYKNGDRISTPYGNAKILIK